MNLPIVIAAAISGTIPGWLQRSNLNQLGYRFNDERQQASPGARWWVIPASTLTAATTAALDTTPNHRMGLDHAGAVGDHRTLAGSRRLRRVPDTQPATSTHRSGHHGRPHLASGRRDSTHVLTGALGGIIAGALFATLHAITRGGIGFGDV